jgi:hypothetical protein
VKKAIFITVLLVFASVLYADAQTKATKQSEQKMLAENKEKLVIVWSSGDREVALKMVFMYIQNSKKFQWWKHTTLVIWGPSAKLLSEDKELQALIAELKCPCVEIKACKMCADSYGVSEKLEALGVEVKYMSELTDFIKEGRPILTF